MAKPLLIPGTQATTLVDQNGDEIYDAVRMGLPLIAKSLGGLSKDEWVAVMSMELKPGDLAPVRTSLQEGRSLGHGPISRTPYSLLDYEDWGYDWRADLRWNAERLVDDLEIRLGIVGERANLVGHSQGGMIIVLASKIAGPTEWSRLVKRVVLVGSPLAGTMVALEAILTGSGALGSENRVLARDMARSWPALHQMLPSWPCIEDEEGEPRPSEDQIFGANGWPGQTEIQPDMLIRAQECQALLKNPFADFGDVGVRAFMGSNHKTPLELERRSPDDVGELVTEKRAGDNLVPFAHTRGWGDDAFNAAVREFRKHVRNHARLCADIRIVTRIGSFLEGE